MNGENAERGISEALKQASALLRAGSTRRALELLARLDHTYPGRSDVMRMRGIVLARLGREAAAEPLLRAVADLEPGSPEAAADHAHVLIGLGRADEALQRLLPLCAAGGAPPLAALGPVFAFNLGLALKSSGQSAEAVEPLRETLRQRPGHYGALVALGDVFKALGSFTEAASCYREAIAEQPELGTAWWSLANLKSGEFTDAEAAELERRTAVAGREPGEQSFFEFALATALDARGRTGEAFAHYAAGNRLQRTLHPWHRARFSRWMRDLRSAMREVCIPARPAAPAGPRPVFIVSLPRSGSTLTEQILAAHSEVTAGSELPWLPRVLAETSTGRRSGMIDWLPALGTDDWHRLGQAYLDKCRDLYRSTPVFTDKLPGNLPHVGAILAMFPDALVVGVRRDPLDACWSCYRQLFIGGAEFSSDLEDLAAYWKDSDEHLAYWQARAPGRVRVLDYEALVADPERETRALLDFLGLRFEAACLRPQDAARAVTTASAAQVREPIHRGAVGQWQRYREHLAPLLAAFGR